eukprot:3584317-Amphidinium_carterae.2
MIGLIHISLFQVCLHPTDELSWERGASRTRFSRSRCVLRPVCRPAKSGRFAATSARSTRAESNLTYQAKMTSCLGNRQWRANCQGECRDIAITCSLPEHFNSATTTVRNGTYYG